MAPRACLAAERRAGCSDFTVASGLQTRVGTPSHNVRVRPLESFMAEIRVEPRRRSMAWLWILLALIVVGGLVYYFVYYRSGTV